MHVLVAWQVTLVSCLPVGIELVGVQFAPPFEVLRDVGPPAVAIPMAVHADPEKQETLNSEDTMG